MEWSTQFYCDRVLNLIERLNPAWKISQEAFGISTMFMKPVIASELSRTIEEYLVPEHEKAQDIFAISNLPLYQWIKS